MRLVSEAWKFAVVTLLIVHNKILGRYFFLRPYASLGAIRIDVDDDDDDDHGDNDDDGDGDFFMKCWGKFKALVCLASIVIVLYLRGM